MQFVPERKFAGQLKTLQAGLVPIIPKKIHATKMTANGSYIFTSKK
jgi:hypothetical protein